MATPSPRTRASTLSFAWAILLPLATLLFLGVIPSLPSLLDTSSVDEKGLLISAPGLVEKFTRSFLSPLKENEVSIADTSRDTTSMGSAPAASFLETVKARRSWYALDKNLPVSRERIESIVRDAIQTVPSAFNSQTNRVVILFGDEHDKLWDIVTGVLKARVSEDQWASTGQKMAGFKAAAGTVLFFWDTEVVQSFANNIPTYADKFPVWAAQADAMLQHTVWTALAAEGLGANLQHYDPLINDQVAEEWSLPAGWYLSAQLVLGGRVGPAPEPKGMKLAEEKLRVFGRGGSSRSRSVVSGPGES